MPEQYVIVCRVSVVRERVQEVLLARQAVNIPGRTGVGAVQAPGRGQRAVEDGHLHGADLMLPVVTEVVEVVKTLGIARPIAQVVAESTEMPFQALRCPDAAARAAMGAQLR